ncbi:MAG: hypothetical protein AAF108_07570 [Planctomycetota bacterium]
MSDEQANGSESGGVKVSTKFGPIGWVLFPLIPVRLLFRWMYQDTDIRGELLGALIVACLVLVSAVTGYLFGGQEDRRAAQAYEREFSLALYQSQLGSMREFSDGMPKNMAYTGARKGQQIRGWLLTGLANLYQSQALEYEAAAADGDASASERARASARAEQLRVLEASSRPQGESAQADALALRGDWLQGTTHYLALCRGVDSQFESEQVADAVARAETVLDVLIRLDVADPASLRAAIEEMRRALDSDGNPSVAGSARAEVDADLDEASQRLGSAVDLATDTSEGDRLVLQAQAAGSIVSAAQIALPELYRGAVDLMKEELSVRREVLESLKGRSGSVVDGLTELPI